MICELSISTVESLIKQSNVDAGYDSCPETSSQRISLESTWRSTSELLREDTVEENAYLGIQRTRLRSESLMPATSLCGSNDALLLLPNKNEEEEDLNYIQQYNSIKTGVSERNNSFPNETVLKSRRKTVTFGIPLTCDWKSRKGRCIILSGIDSNFMGLIRITDYELPVADYVCDC
ncbi:unnamed protein product [Mytilus edulis]|uniref:Uncharacterized protein n=1 Tax=Mytilus edulis TaxID=6550 RepID=A0A8S3SY74_MYTED|nr:unnamed protein product [Mytilus edulis]